MSLSPSEISQVVANGMCIGCGLCEAVSGGQVRMQMTDSGSLRPSRLDTLSDQQHRLLLRCCPGIAVEAIDDDSDELTRYQDPVWGGYYRLQRAWSADPDIRFRAASGGVLTSLALHLLETQQAAFILHVGADPGQPMRSRWCLSETREQVIANANSRYGPTSPLAGLMQALERRQPFAIVAKPCDLNAVQRLSHLDRRIQELCVARLAMVCGGQSRLSKSQLVLQQLGFREDEVSLFRYRGYGNPGRIRVETRDGRADEQSYMSYWEDESKWDVETRCKFCPDALGAAADLAAYDVWAGGNPVGEDAGFNGVITHSVRGEQLLQAAVKQGYLETGEHFSVEQMNDFQPHQVRKKRSLAARYAGLQAAGLPAIQAAGYQLEELGAQLSAADFERQRQGVIERLQRGKIKESSAG